jgi:hypothetical protein
MSLETNLTAAFQAVAAEINAVRTERGRLADLTTDEKASIVGAINELKSELASAAIIDDTSVSATTVFSSERVQSLIDGLDADVASAFDQIAQLLADIGDTSRDFAADFRDALDGTL